MPSCFAAYTAVIPAWTRFLRARTVSVSSCGFQGFRPRALAVLGPSLVLSKINRRSKCNTSFRPSGQMVRWRTFFTLENSFHQIEVGMASGSFSPDIHTIRVRNKSRKVKQKSQISAKCSTTLMSRARKPSNHILKNQQLKPPTSAKSAFH